MTFGYIAGLHLAGQLAEASAGELDACYEVATLTVPAGVTPFWPVC